MYSMKLVRGLAAQDFSRSSQKTAVETQGAFGNILTAPLKPHTRPNSKTRKTYVTPTLWTSFALTPTIKRCGTYPSAVPHSVLPGGTLFVVLFHVGTIVSQLKAAQLSQNWALSSDYRLKQQVCRRKATCFSASMTWCHVELIWGTISDFRSLPHPISYQGY